MILPVINSKCNPVWHLFVIRVEDRDGLKDYLKSKGISAGIHYPISLPNQPAYAGRGFVHDDYVVSSGQQNKLLSLPIFPELSEDKLEYICDQIKHFFKNKSTACYIITRHHAKKLINLHCRGDKFKLDNGVLPRPVADDLIYNSGNTYAVPLLLYRIELGSSIHPEHIDAFHKGNYDAQMNYWTQTGAQQSIQEIMDYDPYLGRVTESSGKG